MKYDLEFELKEALELMTSDLDDYKNLEKLDPETEDYEHYAQVRYIPEILMRYYPDLFLADWIKYIFKVDNKKEYGIVEVNKQFENLNELSKELTDFFVSFMNHTLRNKDLGAESDWFFANAIEGSTIFIGRKHMPKLIFLMDESVEENYHLVEHIIKEAQENLNMNIEYFTEKDRVFQTYSIQQISLSGEGFFLLYERQ